MAAKPRFTDAELDYLIDLLALQLGRQPYVNFRDRKGDWHDFCPDCKMQLTERYRGHAPDCPQALKWSIIGKIEAWQERKG